jgi:hypothetical protein
MQHLSALNMMVPQGKYELGEGLIEFNAKSHVIHGMDIELRVRNLSRNSWVGWFPRETFHKVKATA